MILWVSPEPEVSEIALQYIKIDRKRCKTLHSQRWPTMRSSHASKISWLWNLAHLTHREECNCYIVLSDSFHPNLGWAITRNIPDFIRTLPFNEFDVRLPRWLRVRINIDELSYSRISSEISHAIVSNRSFILRLYSLKEEEREPLDWQFNINLHADKVRSVSRGFDRVRNPTRQSIRDNDAQGGSHFSGNQKRQLFPSLCPILSKPIGLSSHKFSQILHRCASRQAALNQTKRTEIE